MPTSSRASASKIGSPRGRPKSRVSASSPRSPRSKAPTKAKSRSSGCSSSQNSDSGASGSSSSSSDGDGKALGGGKDNGPKKCWFECDSSKAARLRNIGNKQSVKWACYPCANAWTSYKKTNKRKTNARMSDDEKVKIKAHSCFTMVNGNTHQEFADSCVNVIIGSRNS
jgi:hypothetical protein